jgi:hypothetical protein
MGARFTTVAVATGLAAVVLAAPGAAGPRVQNLTARLTPAQEVGVAVKAPGAAGTFKAKLDGSTLTWSLAFKRLTGPALAAHIHLGKRGVSGPVAVPLCGPCKTGAHGTLTVTAAVAAALGKGRAYANVHTAKNPNGEIRGQVEGGTSAPAPSPSATPGASTGGGSEGSGGGSAGGDYDYGY